MSETIVVTGAAGFVGGQTVNALKDQGHRVIAIDFTTLTPNLRGVPDLFLHEDYASSYVLDTLVREKPKAIIHCAGTSLVGPSIKRPELYYNNNFVKTKTLLDHIIKHRIRTRVIFSSSSSVYGEPEKLPLSESEKPAPVSPYGESKLMIEMMLQSYNTAYDIDYVAFRYFNVCGADPDVRHGQRPGATHIIARILESIRDNREFTLMGTDYDTPDGTCIRDHVHVADVAQAHVLALAANFPVGIYNIGLEKGHSNQEIIDMAESITGQKLNVIKAERRIGDPSRLIGDCERLKMQGWTPQFDLEDMIQHAWQWYQK